MSQPADPRAAAGLRYGVAFALVAALLLLQPLCTATYVKLFYDRGGQLIQPLPPEGIPLPRSMTWAPSTVSLIQRLGPMPLAGVLGWNIALCCLLVYGLLRILNPSFRMTTGVDWDSTLLSRTYMHTAPLIKAFLILIAAFLPMFFLWHLLGLILGERYWLIVLRLAIVGAAAWVLFSRDGVSGDYESGNYHLPQNGSVLRSQLLRGSAAGALAGISVLFGPLDPVEYYFDFFRTLGGVGEAQWWSILNANLAFVGVLAFAWGGILVALGNPSWNITDRWRRGGWYAALLAVVLLAWNRWQPEHLASRFDYVPMSRNSAPQLLARRAGLPAGVAPAQQVILLARLGARAATFTGQSAIGLNASPDDERRIEDFMRRRDYGTSLSLPAYIAMTDAEALQWNSDGVLRVAMLNLEHVSDVYYLRTVLDKLATCGATPDAINVAKRLADEHFSAYPDRNSYVEMGDVLAHIGQKAAAEELYRKASLPPSQVAARAEERTMFAAGKVRGRIRWNGKPIPGLRVGVVPVQATPRLETTPGGEASPFWLRWVAASTHTGPSGEFTLDHLVAAPYFLLVEAPITPRLGAEQFSVKGAPGRLDISFARKEADVGVVDIAIPPPPGLRITPVPAVRPSLRPPSGR